jgi:hypothetical protein
MLQISVTGRFDLGSDFEPACLRVSQSWPGNRPVTDRKLCSGHRRYFRQIGLKSRLDPDRAGPGQPVTVTGSIYARIYT